MQSPERRTSRHMKGKQVAMTLYLPPNKYWLLKRVCKRKDLSMQAVLRGAVDGILGKEAGRGR